MKKLKKLSAFLLALLLTFTAAVPAHAASGPNSGSQNHSFVLFHRWNGAHEQNKEYYIYSGYGAPTATLPGVSYDKASNTLTLSNYNAPDINVSVNEMGDDFKIRLIGDNAISELTVWGYGYGGSLALCGDGSLTVNADKQDKRPISLEAEGSPAKMTVESTVTLNAYVGNQMMGGAIVITGTTVSSGGILFEGNDALNAKVETYPFTNHKTVEVYPLRDSENVRICHPKQGSGFDMNKTYGFQTGFNWIDGTKTPYINVFRMETDSEAGDIGYPILDDSGDYRDFQTDFETLFDFKGSLKNDDSYDDSSRFPVYIIDKTQNYSECSAKPGNGVYREDARYAYKEAHSTSHVDGTEKDEILLYEITSDNRLGSIAWPMLGEDGTELDFTETFDTYFKKEDAGITAHRAYKTWTKKICSSISASYDTTATYVFADSNSSTNGGPVTYYRNVFRVEDDATRGKVAYPLTDADGEYINFHETFDTYFKTDAAGMTETEEWEYAQAYLLDRFRSYNLTMYTKANDTDSYVILSYYPDDVELYDVCRLVTKNGYVLALPVKDQTGLSELPKEYTEADERYYNFAYPDKVLEKKGASSHTHTFKEVIDKAATTTAAGSKHEECTVCGEKKPAVAIPKLEPATKVPDANATVTITNAGKVENGKIVGGEVTYTKPATSKATVVVPDSVSINGVDYAVTSVDKNAFKGDKTVTSITVGANVETIGANAFSGCKNLKKVTIGNNVKTVSSSAFANDTKLNSVKFGSNVTNIGDKAFYKCSALKTVTVPAKVTKIGANAFSGCKNLKTVTMKSKKAPSIGKNALNGIKKNATIKVPKAQFDSYKKKLTAKTGYKKTMKLKKS